MKLSIKEKIGFGSGDMAIAIVMMSMQLILSFFYTDVYGLKPADLAVLLLTVRLMDAFADPIVGTLTDKFDTRWGRYRPYLLFFAIPFGVTIFLMFTTPDFDYTGKLIWAYITYILLTLAYTFIAIPYISLIGVITDDPAERLSANGYRFVMTKIAMFLVSIVVPLMAKELATENLATGYQIAMGCMGVIGTLLCFYCFFTVKERIKHEPSDMPIFEQLKNLLRNDQWVILGIVIAVIMFGGSVRSSVAAYYAKYNLEGGNDLVPYFLTIGVIASILSMVAATWITKFFDKIKMFRYTQIMTFFLGVAMFFCVGRGDVVLAFTFYFLITFVSDMQLPVYWASIAEAVDYGEAKSGKRVSGLAFGGILFFQKFGMGIAGGFVGFALAYFNYQPDVVQTESSLLGLSLMMTIIPSVLHLIVGLLMFKYVINDEYYREIRATLQSQNS